MYSILTNLAWSDYKITIICTLPPQMLTAVPTPPRISGSLLSDRGKICIRALAGLGHGISRQMHGRQWPHVKTRDGGRSYRGDASTSTTPRSYLTRAKFAGRDGLGKAGGSVIFRTGCKRKFFGPARR